jgi:serine/threonine protein phosphatase PrpC
MHSPPVENRAAVEWENNAPYQLLGNGWRNRTIILTDEHVFPVQANDVVILATDGDNVYENQILDIATQVLGTPKDMEPLNVFQLLKFAERLRQHAFKIHITKKREPLFPSIYR